jgi:hypothetical protein
MVVDLRITGAERFAAVARELKAAGDKELRRELAKSLGEATKPLRLAAKRSARDTLPKRGGLAARTAKASLRTTTRTGASPSIKIVGRQGNANLGRLDAGVNRHPVYGNEGKWVTQRVRPGWFSKPMAEGGDEVRRQVVAAVDAVIRKLAGR